MARLKDRSPPVRQGGAGIEWHLRDPDSARPSRRASNLKRSRDGEVSDLAPHEIAAVVVVALMIVVIIVGLLVWISR